MIIYSTFTASLNFEQNVPTHALLGTRKRYGRAKFPFPAPPQDFDHRLETADSNAWAARQHPGLEDLLCSGVLTCVRSEQIKSAIDDDDDDDDNDDGDGDGDGDWLRPMPSPIYIVGTAHADQLGLSATAVRRAVREIQPANVVVELCRTRAYIMNQKVRSSAIGDGDARSDPPGEEAPKDFSFSAFGRSLRLAVRAGGVSSGILTFAMGSASLLTYLVPLGEPSSICLSIFFYLSTRIFIFPFLFIYFFALPSQSINALLGEREKKKQGYGSASKSLRRRSSPPA